MPTEPEQDPPATPDVVVRPGTPSDGEALARLHLAARAAAPMPSAVHPPREVGAWLTGRLATDEVWVAEQEGEPVGYLRLCDAWLDDLYVDPAHSRRGIGSMLLDVAKACRPGGFCLWVFERNEPARAFYGVHGLVELERADGSANEERAPDIRVAWPGERPLEFLRSLVDQVDAELGDLLARRVALTRAIQPHKPTGRRDPGRERAVVAAVAARVPALPPDAVARIVDTVITASLEPPAAG